MVRGHPLKNLPLHREEAPLVNSELSIAQLPRPRLPSDDSRSVRSLFVSDVHLGSKHSQAAALLETLHQHEPELLYIVGDFIDGWKLKRRWRWSACYDQLFERLLELKRLGTTISYAPGNHDNFLRGFLASFGLVELRDQFIHRAADGRRYLVIHGDQFDKVEQSAQWLSVVGTHAYDLMLTTNYWINWARGKRHNRYAFCGMMKRRIKGVVRQVSGFEQQLTEAVHRRQCDGIICGHIHTPRISPLGDLVYCNTGDWVENCTALLEFNDGTMELRRSDGVVLGRLDARQKGEGGDDWSDDPLLSPLAPSDSREGALLA